jgi:hypothetical protein
MHGSEASPGFYTNSYPLLLAPVENQTAVSIIIYKLRSITAHGVVRI